MSRSDPNSPTGALSPLLHAAEDRLRLILANIPDYAIFTIDPNGYVVDWPEGAQRVKGWRPDEIVGQHLSMFYTPEEIAAGAVEQELREAREKGRAERIDWRVRKGGSGSGATRSSTRCGTARAS